MKTVNLNRVDPEMLEDLRSEVELLKQLDHPNVIKLFRTLGEWRAHVRVCACVRRWWRNVCGCRCWCCVGAHGISLSPRVVLCVCMYVVMCSADSTLVRECVCVSVST